MRKLATCMLVLTSLLPAVVLAFTGVTIVISEPSQSNQAFVTQFESDLADKSDNQFHVKVQILKPHTKLVVAENSELVIALGEKAFEAAVKLSHTTPVLGILLTPAEYGILQKISKRPPGSISAITLNQPAIRQISLVKAILPHAKKVDVLIGEDSRLYGEQLKTAAQEHELHVILTLANREAALLASLDSLLKNVDALMLIPDVSVINQITAHPVLYTSYRNKKPVFAYSQATVTAGALAAVLSDSKHLAKQAAEIALSAWSANSTLPSPQVPKYFAVKVNQQVARLLNIPLQDEDALTKKIIAAEAQDK